jgi:hypothetical protein
VVQKASVWHRLSVAQHYGLPTRLMEWTCSPFAALHFARADLDRFNRDCVVWGVNHLRTRQLAPERLRNRLDLACTNVFTVEMLSEEVRSLAELVSLCAAPCARLFEPPSIDDCIVNQFASFSVISDPTVALEDRLTDQPSLYRRVIIPAAPKWEIRDKLDLSNITEPVRFPGLVGLTAWLKRHYSPRVGSGGR